LLLTRSFPLPLRKPRLPPFNIVSMPRGTTDVELEVMGDSVETSHRTSNLE
jgi:hypothetical protein